MTVKELIEKLKEFPEDKEVAVRGNMNGTFGVVSGVRKGKHKAVEDYVCITGGWRT